MNEHKKITPIDRLRNIVSLIKNFGGVEVKNNPTSSEDVLRYLGKDKNKRISYALKRYRAFKIELGQQELDAAIEIAENPEHPRRYELLLIYKEVLRDLHLLSQLRTAKIKITKEPWAIVDIKTKEIDQEATEFFQKQWFESLNEFILDAEFYGHSLIEFGQLIKTEVPNKVFPYNFDCVKIFPREHVCPEKGLILLQPVSLTGISYREEPFNEWLLEAGEPDNLGLLKEISRYAIYKNYSIKDWSRSNEKWGDPLLIIKSSSNDDTENDKKAEFAANFGNNGWALFDSDDQIELLERKEKDGYQVFQEFIKLMNEENSKGINGQTATADEKAFVGAAQVQERILDDYTISRLRGLLYFHNEKTIPFLIKKGFNLKGKQWMPLMFLPEQKEEPNNGKDAPTPPTKKPNTGSGGVGNNGKKFNDTPTLHVGVSNWYNDLCNCGDCNDARNAYEVSADVDKYAVQLINKVWKQYSKNKGIKTSDDLYLEIGKELNKAITDNYPSSNIKFGSQTHTNLLQLKANAQVFALFKKHEFQKQITTLLTEKGEIKSFYQFKKEALAISKDYNKNWLKTEYNTAVGAAQMASKWQGFPEDALLQYQTAGDGKVRDAHALINKTTLPKSDPFWRRNYPPNGWNCRCDVREVNKNTKIKQPEGSIDIQPQFAGNPGETGEVFPEAHPYFEDIASVDKARLYMSKLSDPELYLKNLDKYAEIKKDNDYVIEPKSLDINTGAFVGVHKDKDPDPKEQSFNLKTAIEMSKLIKMPVITRKYVNIDNVSNPEIEIGYSSGFAISDFKKVNGKHGFTNGVASAKGQGINEAVFVVNESFDVDFIIDNCKSRFRNQKSVTVFNVIYKGKFVRVTLDDFNNSDIAIMIRKALL